MKRLAVISGGAKGLGAAMALRLLKEGFEVEAWDLSSQTDLSHPKFELKSVDVTNETAVQKATEELLSKKGIPDVLVCNAGITKDSLLHKMTLADFEKVWRVSVQGTFLLTQALGSAMREHASTKLKAGEAAPFRRIVTLSSVAGLYGNIGQANYAAAKAAVIGFTKSIAKEWGRFNISAICVAPGLMKTEMTSTIPEDVMKSFLERSPMKRMGTPEELAGFIAYLAKEESAFLTGEVIAFAGGLQL